jgi:hypothetical protein
VKPQGGVDAEARDQLQRYILAGQLYCETLARWVLGNSFPPIIFYVPGSSTFKRARQADPGFVVHEDLPPEQEPSPQAQAAGRALTLAALGFAALRRSLASGVRGPAYGAVVALATAFVLIRGGRCTAGAKRGPDRRGVRRNARARTASLPRARAALRQDRAAQRAAAGPARRNSGAIASCAGVGTPIRRHRGQACRSRAFLAAQRTAPPGSMRMRSGPLRAGRRRARRWGGEVQVDGCCRASALSTRQGRVVKAGVVKARARAPAACQRSGCRRGTGSPEASPAAQQARQLPNSRRHPARRSTQDVAITRDGIWRETPKADDYFTVRTASVRAPAF